MVAGDEPGRLQGTKRPGYRRPCDTEVSGERTNPGERLRVSQQSRDRYCTPSVTGEWLSRRRLRGTHGRDRCVDPNLVVVKLQMSAAIEPTPTSLVKHGAGGLRNEVADDHVQSVVFWGGCCERSSPPRACHCNLVRVQA